MCLGLALSVNVRKPFQTHNPVHVALSGGQRYRTKSATGGTQRQEAGGRPYHLGENN